MNRDELIQLSVEGKMKYKKKFLKEADEETIEKIYKEYEAKQLDAANGQLADILVGKFSDLMKQTEMVEKNCDLKKELLTNELFRNDLKSFVGYVTPYLPYVGLISGLITVGGYVIYKKTAGSLEAPEQGEAPKQGEAPERTEGPQARSATREAPEQSNTEEANE